MSDMLNISNTGKLGKRRMARRVSGVKKLRRKFDAASRNRKAKTRVSEALKLPVLNARLVANLAGERRVQTVDALAAEIATFAGVDDAIKRSHRYYHRALGKVYETWFELMSWEEEDQSALLAAVNEVAELKTTKGDGLHILLRSLIDYGGKADDGASAEERRRSSQVAVRRVGRDARALKFAARREVPSDGLAAFIASFPGGVDSMAREESREGKGQIQAGVRAAPIRVKLMWPKGLEEAVLDAFDDSEGVAIFLRPSEREGVLEVVAAHNVNRSAENWCDRLKHKHDLDPLDPVSV
jgi:hypothetical protein